MRSSFQNSLLQEETRYKDDVYRALDAMLQEAQESVALKSDEVQRGAYEAQDSFIPNRELGGAYKNQRAVESLVQNIYEKPYFAHLELKLSDNTKSEHYFLSGSSLDEALSINENEVLVPFRKSTKQPMWEQLFRCYHAKNGQRQSFEQGDGKQVVFFPAKICDDEIKSRKLVSATQLFPVPSVEFRTLIEADELLEQRLKENRSDPKLQNIIATLQQEQFEIIASDSADSFVVQGCAGSGKSQCLLHRLFYLRGELSDGGWEHVLLITPTKLFRLFSSDLMQRYQISNVANCSISELYQALLLRYDARFRNRQYHFELSEEYLPDEYLQKVYSEETIKTIEAKISQSIQGYIATACQTLDIPVPETVTAKTVQSLLGKLDEEISVANSKDTSLLQDPEYAKKRADYETLQKQMDSLQKSLDRQNSEAESMDANEHTLLTNAEKTEQAQHELTEWKKQREEKVRNAKEDLQALREWIESGQFDPDVPFLYAQQLYFIESITSGEAYRADEEYLAFLQKKVEDATQELVKFTGDKTTEQTLTRYQKRRETIATRKAKIIDDIHDLSGKIDIAAERLRQRAQELEGEYSRQSFIKSEMERSKYVLGRLESTVFEQEIWNALLPLKEQYHVHTLDVEKLDEKHQRETRILYKSDLLFYLKIYTTLHAEAKLPEYNLFCIDEGQDLHKADYDFLHQLYPKARFNIFGDTLQVLHTACGVKNWTNDTGIKKIYHLDCNYRNPAAIADFCNKEFKSKMKYLGKPRPERYPTLISGLSQLPQVFQNRKTVFIVRDYEAFRKFCNLSGKSETYFEYLDTTAEKATGEKPACYSVFAAKGLEFSTVCVYPERMTTNQKVVSCTRATEVLYYYAV